MTFPVRIAGVYLLGLALVVVLAGIHVTQGTSSVDAGDLVRWVTGRGDPLTGDVLVASRLPRVLAGVLVGVALGVAGMVLQSLARNPLAAPDTLGVDAGAYLAVVACAAFGLSLPLVPAGLVAFAGGLVSALIVLLAAGGAGPSRVVLAGSAISIGFSSLSILLLLLFEPETTGLYAWGQGSLVQSSMTPILQLAPLVAAAVLGVLLIARRLDVLSLGDDAATSLGVHVGRTRLIGILLAVLLSASAVTITGPIGFVGLCAPVVARMVARAVPGLHEHRLLVPLAALAGVIVVLAADVLLRAVLGADRGVSIPAGVVTTLAGAGLLIGLARRLPGAIPGRREPDGASRPRSRRALVLTTAVVTSALIAGVLGGLLLGDTKLLLGDLANWIAGRSGVAITFVLDQRLPRVLAAVLAGAALGLSGAAIQAVSRNPLAEPGILGITGGAGVGAIALISFAPAAGVLAMSAVAGAGALIAFALVYGLAWRQGLNADRLVLIGIGVWYGSSALITFMIVLVHPYDTATALTWLAGSTYGRTLPQVVPVAIALAVMLPLLLAHRRELDLMSIDDDTPRTLGVPLERTRLLLLTGSALLAAAAVSAAGTIAFVGLVVPHATRALVGSRHVRVLPVAALLGALLVSLADTLGRTVIAPAQVPAGLVTALIGTPYFAWLLWRSRPSRV